MKAFCACGREHRWTEEPNITVLSRLCRCGRVLESQTEIEFTSSKEAHEAVLARIAQTLGEDDGDWEPCVRFFQD
jgi:hypothetical protein